MLVTFIYDHCPDICPLIVGNLHTAQAQLGPEADKLQIVAVSVDPRGDTPHGPWRPSCETHRMTGRMEYLIGSRPQLERVWRDWSILSKATPTKRDPDLVEHSALVYGISASGRITTLYSHDFARRRSCTTCRFWRRSKGRTSATRSESAWWRSGLWRRWSGWCS